MPQRKRPRHRIFGISHLGLGMRKRRSSNKKAGIGVPLTGISSHNCVQRIPFQSAEVKALSSIKNGGFGNRGKEAFKSTMNVNSNP